MFKNTVKLLNSNLLPYYEIILGRTLSSLKPSPGTNRTGNLFHRPIQIMDTPTGLFQGVVDRFNGITIDSNAEAHFNDNFNTKLEKSLEFWKETKRRGIWFKVRTENVECVPELAKKGFNFHHAKKGFVMMYKWLPEDESENIPTYAHTMLGVGGIVVNENNEVLVVSDKYAMIPGSWKLPGGYVEPGEYLPDAVVREVHEETGIETEYQSLISLRHAHGGGFGCSDIYVVIGLKPKSSEIKRCEREIAKVCWMPLNEYLSHPNVHETNRMFLRKFLFFKENGIKFDFDKKTHQILKREYSLFDIKNADW